MKPNFNIAGRDSKKEMRTGPKHLPDSWELATLKEIGIWSGGGTPSKEKPDYWVGGNIPWVSPKDMKSEKVQSSEDHITEAAVSETTVKLIAKGSVLVVTRSGILRHTLPISLTTLPVTINQDLKALTVHKGILPEYAAWALRAFAQKILNTCSKQGTTVQSIETAKLLRFQIPLAPYQQQKRIVAEIEKQFSRLDEAVASLKRAKANLKRYKAAVLKAAVEGKLTEEWRKAHPDVEPASKLLERILAERRRRWEEAELAKMKAKGKAPRDNKWKKNYKEPVSPDTTGLPELPKSWEWAGWEQIGFSQNGRPFPSGEYCEKGVKLLRPGNLHESGTLVWTSENTRHMPARYADERSDLILRGGEVVMNLTAQSLKDEFLGRVCLTPDGEYCLLNQRLARLTPILVSPAFALIVFKSKWFRKFVDGLNTGSLIQHMFISQFATFAFPLPPLPEQQRIIQEVERHLSLVLGVGRQIEANLQRCERLRQSILNKAFSGQLAPQNPEDEPASLLLEETREAALPRSKYQAPKTTLPVANPTPRNSAKATLPISSAADSILNHMHPNREYSRAEIMDALGLSVSQWNVAIRELKEQEKVRQTGERRGAKYKVPNE